MVNDNNSNVKYETHVQNIGWQGWKKNGEVAGTEGQGLRLEAIQIRLKKKTPKTQIYIDTNNNI